MTALLTTQLPFPVRRGKVRDVYDLGEHLLIVATDRISAFDVVMNEGVPGKGRILTQVANFWFKATQDIIANHLVATDVAAYPASLHAYADQLEGRSILVRRAKVVPIECVVRGYLAGSGLKEYRTSGTVCGIPLPSGLRMADRLPEPIFTPSTKAEVGHDENIDFDRMAAIVGRDLALRMKDASLALYRRGVDLAKERGIILADTKFEFGLLEDGGLILVDEALTPDSSRYWLADLWQPGVNPPSLDKQFLRDYLETLHDWNRQAPAPHLPGSVIAGVQERYRDLANRFGVQFT
ncbi:MAG TPA: phosphoribosylaminoimidazolesuccinocarboxamide synthase [Holophaga sp.]|nr:phosphoribosylaminoimidazolesuccinocarboxamide synthase [Holophaga sp.]HPS66412.1 phosphoribosylaminoimidazolesuccinocarboxamide synthase [Holophaga sp.]